MIQHKSLRFIVLAGLALFGPPLRSSLAATITIGGTAVSGQGQVSSVAGSHTVDFNNGTTQDPYGNAVYSAGATVYSSSIPNQSSQPVNDSTAYLSVGPSPQMSSVTITFNKAVDYFGLYVGTPDSYNSLQFFSGTSTNPVLSLSGSGVSGLSDGMFVNFFADPGQSYSRVVLSSSSYAFETDNHAYRVAATPEPGTLSSLLLAGGSLAGFKLYRRRQAELKG